MASPFSSSCSPHPPVPQSALPFSALILTGLSPVLIHSLWSPAAQRETSEDCRSCLECSRDNGCVRCPERLFLFLQREGMSHHGTCLHACPAGHYGQRGKDINRCMSMSQTNPQKKCRQYTSPQNTDTIKPYFSLCCNLMILQAQFSIVSCPNTVLMV